MIPATAITSWGETHHWPTREQIEQDFLLSQAICEIANNKILGQELVMRGGTALHKLFLPEAYRYSEDLDYVRSSEGGIGYILDQLTQLGVNLGYKANTKIGKYPKVFWRGVAESGLQLRIKIEINTYERTPVIPLVTKKHSVNVSFYSSSAEVRVFQTEELMATKLRALYQSVKGRDLFDLWLALELLNLSPTTIVEIFKVYRPESLTAALLIENLEEKLATKRFVGDLDSLGIPDKIGYQANIAGRMVIDRLFRLL
jgi:predicted nucleotidyltransferase component of viral defense system